MGIAFAIDRRRTISAPSSSSRLAIMKQFKFWRSIVLAFTAMGFAGCATDLPTAPKFQSDPSTGLVSDLLGGLLQKKVLERKTALTKDITVSAVIGEKGGTLSIPAAGFTVTIPAGAVKAPTNFSVTAIKGSMVAYEFGPHGIKFAKSLSAQQDLRVTKWGLLSLRPLVAGYFADRSALDLRNVTALVSEVLSGVIAPLTQQFTFKIDHFSGYVVAW
jgi:hypothetical protein